MFLEEGKQLEFRGLVALPTDGLHDFTASLEERHVIRIFSVRN